MGLRSDDPMPLLPEEEHHLTPLALAWKSSSLCEADKSVLDETLHNLKRIFSLTSPLVQIDIGPSAATLSWIITIPERFCEMVELRVPQALVLIAVYCILLKRSERVWWISGKAESLFSMVKEQLPGSQWKPWLDWPGSVVEGPRAGAERSGGGMVGA